LVSLEAVKLISDAIIVTDCSESMELCYQNRLFY